jgi:O-6-methylguanine DNA methyltransferase
MIPDRVDAVLDAYFRPAPLPPGFAARMTRAVRAARDDLQALLGRLAIDATARGIRSIREGRQPDLATAAARRLAGRARTELAEYLAGKRAFFSVPLDLSGVPAFQRRVLETAAGIPFGEVRAYAWVAERTGHPRAVRAVGTALGRNPVPIIVPCHRVLRSDGGLGGYLFGLDVKDRLIDLERRTPVLEGCTTTRIVCRVGCVHGRHMRGENRVVFASLDDARSVGYRPCRVCKPAAAA